MSEVHLNQLKITFLLQINGGKDEVIEYVYPGEIFIDVIRRVLLQEKTQMKDYTIVTPSGMILTASDMYIDVQEIINRYHKIFKIIDKGMLG